MPRSPKSVRRGLLAALAALAAAAGAEGGQPPFVKGHVLVKMRPGAGPAAAQAAVASVKGKVKETIPGIGVLVIALPERADERAAVRGLGGRPEVQFAELDEIHPLDATPNDPSYGSQWHLPKIGAPSAWSTTWGDGTVVIAILDTGCDPSHPDLKDRYVPGWNFYDNNENSADVHGHGTAVAGTAAATVNNGVGVAGVAGACAVMPIRISAPDGGGSTSNMAKGLVFAADRFARAANISYMVSESSTVTTAAKYFMAAGGVVCVSAGNYSTVSNAADNPYILTISATDSSDKLASFTNTGTNIDLGAPGVGIRTTTKGGGYANWSGTSFSSPVVAGVAALVFSANPDLSATQAVAILKQAADDLGPPGWDPGYGAGRVNAAAAVSLAIGTGGDGDVGAGGGGDGGGPAPDTVAPTITITAPAHGTVIGTGKGAVESVTVEASDDVGVARVELRVNGKLTATAASAPFTMKWNVKKVAPGAHALQCVAYDAAGNMGVSEVVTVYR